MDETGKVLQDGDKSKIVESPKPIAFTVDFGENRPLDTAKYKNLVEKYQQYKHRRGQSLSKIEEPPKPPIKKHPLTGNLPRKTGYNAEGYHSSDEKVDKKLPNVRSSVLNCIMKKGDLTLPLKSITTDRMTQSFPSRSFDLPVIDSPEVEIKDISSPELDSISPLSPLVYTSHVITKSPLESNVKHCEESTSSEEAMVDTFKSCVELNDKSDNISDAGTYTIETDNYTEEQKLKMSIDKDFNIEQVSVQEKTQEYIQNLIIETPVLEEKPQNDTTTSETITIQSTLNLNNSNKSAKVINSNQRSKPSDVSPEFDRGVFTLVTTSGVLNKQQQKMHCSSHNLVKSVVALETYPSNLNTSIEAQVKAQTTNGVQRINKGSQSTVRSITQTLFAQNISVIDTEYHANIPTNSGSNSPIKLTSPLHTARNRNSFSSGNCDFSDSSLETESYLKSTQNVITSLQQRLSIDSDSDNDKKYNLPLNNETKILLKHKPVHVRHNSFDDRNIKLTNKLEHFHNKNLQGIDQTLKSCNQYKLHQIQNSPNNSPIRRSSSFSLKNQFDNQQKYLNTQVKDNNYRKVTNSHSGTSIQRSSSSATIKPKTDLVRRASINSDCQDRNNYLETESSSEEDFDKNITKTKKDLTSTRYNRAFSLRRARLDVETTTPKCPNTPEMKRKFAPTERTVSVDRKGSKSADIQSRYLNISKSSKNVPVKVDVAPKNLPPKNLPKPQPSRQSFSRTDSGRFSLRSPKPLSASQNKPQPNKKDAHGKKQSGPRSNSTLSSREVEFQNWKRRKSYDPMKAAAEGKRKAELAKKSNIMTQSYNEHNQEYDSSPSHSSSVHRSQSFHGTAALEQNLISSEDDELTLSGDDGFSPPIPSPCLMSPSKNSLRAKLWREKYSGKN